MKIQLESIRPDTNSSFHLMVNPRLSDLYFWHFHPELELVYIVGTDGRRQVGDHIGRYQHHDLVLIGSNMPHLNFDFGAKTDYRKSVLHIQPDFLGNAFPKIPELAGIQQLFEASAYGIAFSGETLASVGARMLGLHVLPSFEQFLEVLRLLQTLANSTEKVLLHEAPYKNQHNQKHTDRMRLLYRFLDDNYHRKITLAEVAALCHLTEAAFCRYFKQMSHLTFTDFLNHYRIGQAKRLLLLNKTVAEVCYASGFESLSYFNRVFKKITLKTPVAYKKQML